MAPMFCPSCGKQLIVTGQKFCAYCAGDLSIIGEGARLAPRATAGVPPVAPLDTPIVEGAAPSTTSINPALLVIGGIVVVVIVAVLFVVRGNSGGSGSIAFSPSTFNCSNPVALVDGHVLGSAPVGMTQQADGSWVAVSTTSLAQMQSLCALGGAPALGIYAFTPGTHIYRILDSSGDVLAQGSYTVTP
jgi:hypothetical protein